MIRHANRDTNLDIIRTAAIFFVLTVHFYDSSGFPAETMGGPVDFMMLCGWFITHSCVPMFIMLSGWLCSKKELSAKYYLGFIRIALIYLICSAACLVFRGLYLGEELGLRYIFGSVVNFYACGYAWYVMLYFGLFLLIPFLNLIYNGLDSKSKKLCLIFTVFALSILPSLLNQFIQLYSIWWTRLYPLCYYFIGAYLREYRPRLSGAKTAALLVAAVLLFSLFDLFYYSRNAMAMIGIAYENYQVFSVSVLLFMLLLKIPTGKLPSALCRSFAFVSELSFTVYLISWIPDNLIYPALIAAFPVPADRFVWMLPCSLLALLSSLVLAWLIDFIYRPLASLTRKLLCRCFPALN